MIRIPRQFGLLYAYTAGINVFICIPGREYLFLTPVCYQTGPYY